MSTLPQLKASSERDILHKNKLMKSHVLTKQNTILVKKETVMIKYGKEAFILLFPLMKYGCGDREEGEGTAHRENASSKFQIV